MGFGRLIRVRSVADPEGILYVVAEHDPEKAIGILKDDMGRRGYEMEDLGRVTGRLLDALKLKPGEFTKA
jgi:hypothetical protein